MAQQKFGGDQKVGESLLGAWEKRFVAKHVVRVPPFIETYHLTLFTLLWSALALIFFWRAGATGNLHWLWLVSLMILCQYLTDLFDGAVGRHRDTGLIKWGFYMDHFFDYVFLCSLVIGYYLIAPRGLEIYFFGLLALTGGFMVNSFLSFASTNEFEIYFFGIGPTEIRLIVILLNASVTFLGTAWWPVTVPLFFYAFLAGLVLLCFKCQRRLWKLDMEIKSNKKN